MLVLQVSPKKQIGSLATWAAPQQSTEKGEGKTACLPITGAGIRKTKYEAKPFKSTYSILRTFHVKH